MISVITGFLFLSSHLQAVELGNFGSRIFQFQQKLADRGNVLAQYKLGTLYEFGVSVPASVEQAKIWYEKAAKKEYVPAINRLIYLEIIQSGFDQKKHGQWFDKLQEQASLADANALILLGQMRHNGVHVKTDLVKALALLSQASSLGHTEVDSEIDAIQRKIEKNNQESDAKRNKVKSQSEPDKKTVKSSKKQEKLIVPDTKKIDERLSKEAKHRRYEEAMRKLQQEAQMLEEQQKWAEGI